MEVLIKLIIVLAICFGVDAVIAQFVLFLLGSFHVDAGFWQAFAIVVLASIIAGGSAKAAS